MKNLTWKSFHATELRKFKDPVIQNVEHHVMLVQAKALPTGLSHKPNPRANSDLFAKRIYETVQESLLNSEDPTFHLKNKGIVLTATQARFEKGDNGDILHLGFSEDDGILDGSHTYRIIERNLGTCPDNQHVRIEARVGDVKALLSDMAEGLNTSVQVQQQSLANYRGEFDWIKTALKGRPYYGEIAWVEHEDKEIPVQLLIRLMTAFNLGKFPSNASHPVISYSGKSACLDLYLSDCKKQKDGTYVAETYGKLREILPDILELHDYLHLNAKDIYNRGQHKWGKATSIVEKRHRGEFSFPFTGTKSKDRIREGAIYPILGAFRSLVVEDKNKGVYKWRAPFADVKKVFETVGGQLLDMTLASCGDFNHNVQTLGKKSGHWNNLYVTVENYALKNLN